MMGSNARTGLKEAIARQVVEATERALERPTPRAEPVFAGAHATSDARVWR